MDGAPATRFVKYLGELESDDVAALEDTGPKFPGIVVGADHEPGEAIYPRHQEEDAG